MNVNFRHWLSHTKWLNCASSVLIGTLLVGCGGGISGIDGSGSKPVTEVSVSEPINGFGSVILNGVHYDTDNAKVFIRGELTDEFELEVGDFVTLVGSLIDESSGVASEIHYQPKVTGVIDRINEHRHQFSVLKQRVQTDSNTIFSGEIAPKNFFGLKLDASISVSGATDANGTIRATRVAIIDSQTVEISGPIHAIDFDQALLKINGLEVDVSGVGAAGTLQPGQNVYARGVLSDDILVASAIDTSMDIAKLRFAKSNRLKGFVGEVIDRNQFTIEGVTVVVDGNTRFKNGAKVDIFSNQKVRVKGKVNEGAFVAQTVEFLDNANLQVTGEIEQIVAVDRSARDKSDPLGYIKVQGQAYTLMRNTSLQKARERYFSFRDFRIGDTVSVSAFSDGTQNVATKITVQTEHHDFSEFSLEGGIYDVDLAQNQFRVFNTLVLIDPNTQYHCRKDIDDCSDLALENNMHAKVRGKMTAAGFLATSIRMYGSSNNRKEREFINADTDLKSKRGRNTDHEKKGWDKTAHDSSDETR